MSREDELIDQRHEAVMGAIKGVHDRLDVLNGRTRTIETRVAVLEDRSPGRVASIVSAVVSGAITGLGMLFGSKQ